MSTNLAVIPARGGSKRIPGKNTRVFRGRPLIEWAIRTALDSCLFNDVIVTTESIEISKLSNAMGAETPFMRPAQLADDFTPTVPVIQDAIKQMLERDKKYDNVCCIYPTAVSITAGDLSAGLELLEFGGSIDYAFAVVEYPYPIKRALVRDDKGIYSMEYPENLLVRSQDLDPRWHDAGQFYWARTETWLEGKPMLQNSRGIEVPSWRVQDIDSEDDWTRAEFLAELVDSVEHK